MRSDAEYIHASDHNIRDMPTGVHANDQTSVICSYMHVTYRRGGYKRNPKMMLAPSRFRLAALVIFAIVDNSANSDEQQDSRIQPLLPLLPLRSLLSLLPLLPLLPTTTSNRPNVVFILTDDQDVHLDSLSY